MAFLKYLALLPLLIGIVRSAVALVEDTVDDGVVGADKKKAVLTAIKEGWASAQQAFGFNVAFEAIETVLSYLIDLTVAVYNAVGFFKKKTQAPA